MRKFRPHNGVKIFLTLSLILGSVAYAFHQQSESHSALAVLSANTATIPPAQSSATQVATAPAQAPAQSISPPATTPTPPVSSPPPPPKPTGQYIDGSYTGSVADAYYGLVQVSAVVSGGKLVDVKFLQYPSDRSTSREINRQAMPLLTQEAIQAQSARVDGVSGASDTSAAFVESLGNALAKAKA